MESHLATWNNGLVWSCRLWWENGFRCISLMLKGIPITFSSPNLSTPSYWLPTTPLTSTLHSSTYRIHLAASAATSTSLYNTAGATVCRWSQKFIPLSTKLNVWGKLVLLIIVTLKCLKLLIKTSSRKVIIFLTWLTVFHRCFDVKRACLIGSQYRKFNCI